MCSSDLAVLQNPVTFFLQGAAGAGKMFVYNALCYAACLQNLHVLCVASSGIAALLLPGGRTAHSALKIPIDIDYTSTCSISKRSSLANTLKDVRLLIWDECLMQNHFMFEAIDRSLQDIRDDPSLFGGIMLCPCRDTLLDVSTRYLWVQGNQWFNGAMVQRRSQQPSIDRG